MKKLRIAVALGTRPEVVKLAPVVKVLRSQPETFEVSVLSTGQHRQMLDQALAPFGLEVQTDLRLMRENQTLPDLTALALTAVTGALASLRPDMLLVQGDTTTVLAASLAAFYARVPVGHVEAGLRSHDMANPFPEEANRRLTSVLAELHFAPTPGAGAELLREGVAADRVVITGNTVVDALLELSARPFNPVGTPLEGLPLEGKRVALVTSHRRESFDGGIERICLALAELARAFPDLAVVYPLHLNPNVRRAARSILEGCPGVHLTEPLDYPCIVHLMRRAELILTDSGGIQEEAPTFDTPVLVLRTVTERPEASQRGQAVLVGTDKDLIVATASRLLTDPAARAAMTGKGNPYGDGRAAGRIARAIQGWAGGQTPPLPPELQFVP
ncbi:UDP-N-acetylglucosamine 2-epimerase [Fundidesulfovibrio magnetotacticus]|uniref:UDP-N-acetylglucosamine 2-epimerase (non-hydrolyzing) n=1 Tax=Fundidesulfovibrio magnetotacticus TaxID=2730080 RepID=A0A6V8LQF9_9BACT|nr:UDP-N-acetylglucosamine 2-epimerase (non-hydrolyzing) [Fundidesulfovibrio magnetotacticus]GFK92578.1 UDP-N-acetylglucosamine 2-epimerase [Fundidesulfovibrio magnetotacticus]